MMAPTPARKNVLSLTLSRGYFTPHLLRLRRATDAGLQAIDPGLHIGPPAALGSISLQRLDHEFQGLHLQLGGQQGAPLGAGLLVTPDTGELPDMLPRTSAEGAEDDGILHRPPPDNPG